MPAQHNYQYLKAKDKQLRLAARGEVSLPRGGVSSVKRGVSLDGAFIYTTVKYNLELYF